MREPLTARVVPRLIAGGLLSLAAFLLYAVAAGIWPSPETLFELLRAR